MLKKIILICMVLLNCNLFAQSKPIVLWFSEHSPHTMQAQNTCQSQPIEFEKYVKNASSQKIDGLTFATELVRSEDREPNFQQIESDVLREYVGLHVTAKAFAAKIMGLAQQGPIANVSEQSYFSSWSNIMAALFNSVSGQQTLNLANSLLNVEQNNLHASVIQDFKSARQAFLSQSNQIDSNFYLMLMEAIDNPGNVNNRQSLANYAGQVLDVYQKFTVKYFNAYIAPQKSSYAVSADFIPGATNKDIRTVFDLLQPQNVVSNSSLMEDFYTQALTYHLREYDMAKNFFTLLNTHPDDAIVVWVGVGHSEGVVKQILQSKQLNQSIMQRLLIVDQRVDQALACNADAIARAITDEHPVGKTLQAWAKIKNIPLPSNLPTDRIFMNGQTGYQVIDLNGQMRLSKVSSEILSENYENIILNHLKQSDIDNGVYLIRVVSQGIAIKTYKISLIR